MQTIGNPIIRNKFTSDPTAVFFYHNGALPHGGSHRRSVCVDYLYYNDDDTMKRVVMTSEGVHPIV